MLPGALGGVVGVGGRQAGRRARRGQGRHVAGTGVHLVVRRLATRTATTRRQRGIASHLGLSSYLMAKQMGTSFIFKRNEHFME